MPTLPINEMGFLDRLDEKLSGWDNNDGDGTD